jgi:hypothetical protein
VPAASPVACVAASNPPHSRCAVRQMPRQCVLLCLKPARRPNRKAAGVRAASPVACVAPSNPPHSRCAVRQMPRQCVLLCLKPIRKRLMRCQLRPFSYVVLPRPDTPWGWLTAPAGGWFLLSRQWGMVTMSWNLIRRLGLMHLHQASLTPQGGQAAPPGGRILFREPAGMVMGAVGRTKKQA